MDSKYKKLELCWPGKDMEVRPEPRVLIEDPEKSYGETNTGNMLIHADNLLALKSLEQKFAGKIKCVYIDPPYNTGNAFEHYDDGLEHSTWLNLMKPRLELLYKLLSNDGSIWISIDADESHYLKVACDEIFGRNNFVDEVIWQRAFAPINLKKTLSRSHDIMLVYSKNSNGFELNRLFRSESQLKNYKNPDNDPRGKWTSSDCTVGPVVKEKLYKIELPSGRFVTPPDGRCWLFTQERFEEMIKENRIWFGANGNNAPRVKKFITEVKDGVTSMTLWLRDEVGDNQEAKREIKEFNSDDVFTTPKPERLIHRVIQLATNEGDIVLDSFLGSGTTAAVAHKMGRKWIGIELGEHCNTHCLPRLKAVCDGTDQGGISKAMEWKGGGGFKYYELAPSLLNKDKYEQWVINPEYNAQLLAAAMAKHEGFTYCPDETVVWKQGYATKNHFIFTTTNTITPDIIEQIVSEMQPGESLRICCTAYVDGCNDINPRIEVKKIPALLLGKCEFGKEDYCTDAGIINFPADPDKPEFVPSYIKPDVKPEPAKIENKKPVQGLLF